MTPKRVPFEKKDRAGARRLAESEAKRRHLEELLDEALASTFPASDPISVS